LLLSEEENILSEFPYKPREKMSATKQKNYTLDFFSSFSATKSEREQLESEVHS
jgi:hypothetical protein